MDPITLTAIAAFLAPYLKKAGEKVAEKTVEKLFESRGDLAKKFYGLFNRDIITLGLNDSATTEEVAKQLEAKPEVKTEINTKVAANQDLLNELVEAFKQMPQAEFSGITINAEKISAINVSNTSAQNLGTQVNAPQAPVTITNVFESEKTQPALPSNIPAAKGFVGREDELKSLHDAKQNGRTSFVLHGTGGVGKTELALKFIEEVKRDFQVHIRVDMQGLANALSPDDAMLEVIRAFKPDVPSLPSEQIKDAYISLLNQHKTLLFFDNARDREQVELLNQSAAFVIITSRTTFNVTGGFSEETEQMSPKDARDLLYSIAGEARFDGKADELAYIAGYLPMALSPLASILVEDVMEDAASLIRKYSDRKERLRLADPNRENLSVEASFELSYERLSDELKERWRKLAVFPADFDLEVLKVLWKDENAKESLSALVKSNLVIFDEKNKRSRLHDLARDYAREKLGEEEFFRTGGLHSFYYGNLLISHRDTTLKNLAIFDLERANIEKGSLWVKDRIQLSEDFARLCINYTGYANDILILRFHPREYIKWLEMGLVASRKINSREAERSHLGNLGNIYIRLGEYSKAIEYCEQSLAISIEINDRKGENIDINNLGVVYRRLEEYKKAIEYFERALVIAKEGGNRLTECYVLGNLGNSYWSLRDHTKAIEYYEQTFVIAKEIGDRLGEGGTLGNLGAIYKNLGEYQKAIEHCEQALVIAKEIGDREIEGVSLSTLGSAYYDLGEKEKAIDLLKKAIQVFEEIESPDVEIVRVLLMKMEAE